MNAATLLPMMKIDLGISGRAFDDRLTDKITVAAQRIEREGVTLTESESDRDLVLMYAEWLWLHRIEGGEMPRMVRYALNNRVLGPAAQVNP